MLVTISEIEAQEAIEVVMNYDSPVYKPPEQSLSANALAQQLIHIQMRYFSLRFFRKGYSEDDAKDLIAKLKKRLRLVIDALEAKDYMLMAVLHSTIPADELNDLPIDSASTLDFLHQAHKTLKLLEQKANEARLAWTLPFRGIKEVVLNTNTTPLESAILDLRNLYEEAFQRNATSSKRRKNNKRIDDSPAIRFICKCLEIIGVQRGSSKSHVAKILSEIATRGKK